MRSHRVFVMLGVVLLTGMVALANKVTSDYDRTTNFSKYRTFMWIQPPEVKEAFMSSRIMESVNGHLTVRGLRQVCEGADLAVGSHLATEERHTWETYYSGSDWGWGPTWSTTEMRTYEVGTLTVDLFDAESHKAIWQGVGVDKVSSKPEKQTRDLDKQIDKMFRYFPYSH